MLLYMCIIYRLDGERLDWVDEHNRRCNLRLLFWEGLVWLWVFNQVRNRYTVARFVRASRWPFSRSDIALKWPALWTRYPLAMSWLFGVWIVL